MTNELIKEYIGESRFMPSAYIHGDPVFSNIILEKKAALGSSGVKFIDMRGALGGRLTTSGDVLYDLSKLYVRCVTRLLLNVLPPTRGQAE